MATISANEFLGGGKAKVVTPAVVDTKKKPGSNVGSDISNAFNSGIEQIKSGYSQSYNAKNPIQLLEGGLKQGAGLFNAVSAPLAPAFKPIGDVVNYAGDKLSNTNLIKGAAGNETVKSNGAVEYKPNLSADRVLEDINNTNAIAGGVAGSKLANNAGTSVTKVISGTIDDALETISKPFGDIKGGKINMLDKISEPNVSEATKVSLNPVEVLKNKNQDFLVSVGGKNKKISELNINDKTQIKDSTARSLKTFKKEAETFKKNRNPLNDPTEIVGQRVDKALTFADKKRQFVGQKMGEIEQKYTNESLPISEKTLEPFVETIKNFDNPKFGMDTANAPTVRKLVSDLDALNKNGATIGERLEFIRSWDTYLRDSKDGFGNFKENATVNQRIQNAVKALKEETVNSISTKDKIYRGLRSQYRTFKSLDEIGNSLLGKDGALGDRIKGGATVKRALKSNSDAGARQFLIKLKELTGYDALKDGDLALTAMELAGDYQGLSLLEVLKQGKSGVINKLFEKGQDLLIGNNSKRIEKYIKK